MLSETTQFGYLKKRKLSSFYKNFVGKSDLVFVYGDQTGALTELFTQIGTKVVLIQPMSQYWEMLDARLSKNTSCIIIKEDVGAFETEFFYNGIYEKHILPYSSNLSADENQEYIKITTLDNIIQQYGKPALCVICGEGYEGEILNGLNQTLLHISWTFYTFSHDKTTKIIRRLLNSGNYEFNWRLAGEISLQSKQWLSAKVLTQSITTHSRKSFGGELFARICVSEDEI